MAWSRPLQVRTFIWLCIHPRFIGMAAMPTAHAAAAASAAAAAAAAAHSTSSRGSNRGGHSGGFGNSGVCSSRQPLRRQQRQQRRSSGNGRSHRCCTSFRCVACACRVAHVARQHPSSLRESRPDVVMQPAPVLACTQNEAPKFSNKHSPSYRSHVHWWPRSNAKTGISLRRSAAR